MEAALLLLEYGAGVRRSTLENGAIAPGWAGVFRQAGRGRGAARGRKRPSQRNKDDYAARPRSRHARHGGKPRRVDRDGDSGGGDDPRKGGIERTLGACFSLAGARVLERRIRDAGGPGAGLLATSATLRGTAASCTALPRASIAPRSSG